jgi:hypothetical protein
MVTSYTKLQRARPCLPLRDDDDGYAIVHFAALRRILKKRNTSTRFVALTLMQLRYGQIVNTPERPENIRAAREGRAFEVSMDEKLQRGNEKDDGGKEHARNKSAFHARADNLARKERKLGKLDGKTDDGRWFIAMVKAWMLCLDGNGARSVAMARRLSASVGEEDYFKREMFPIFMRRCTDDEPRKIE